MKKKYVKKHHKKQSLFLPILLTVLVLCVIFGVAFAAINQSDKIVEIPNSSTESTSSAPKEPYVVSTATVINTGDLLMHSPIISGAKNADGTYDFSGIFSVVKKYFDAADLAVANLEVTLGGTESGPYSGYPCFNLPDSFADDIKNGGIDMLLTANNHSYDTGLFGLQRTAQVLKQKNIPFIGTREVETDPIYTVKEVNGINIGMACYTYENVRPQAGRKSLNGNIIKVEANNLISSFAYEALDEFYLDAENTIRSMREGGAECIVFYMHWGEEYKLSPNSWQKNIAQKLCDLGVDVIVGGHPHVVQPMEMLHSSDGLHSTVCIYSMGNAVSNQRQSRMTSCPTGHTEDGMLFYYTFEKYSDGKVALSDVKLIPTWVGLHNEGGKSKYVIYPIENYDSARLYGLGDADIRSANTSLDRTVAVVNESLVSCSQFLSAQTRFVNATPINPVE